MNEWTRVNSWKELPTGNWLVQIAEPRCGLVLHTASVHPNVTVIGGLFGFDMPRVIAYRKLPNVIGQSSELETAIRQIIDLMPHEDDCPAMWPAGEEIDCECVRMQALEIAKSAGVAINVFQDRSEEAKALGTRVCLQGSYTP